MRQQQADGILGAFGGELREEVDCNRVKPLHVARAARIEFLVALDKRARIGSPLWFLGRNRINVTAQHNALARCAFWAGLAPEILEAVAAIKSFDANFWSVKEIANHVEQWLGRQSTCGIEAHKAC